MTVGNNGSWIILLLFIIIVLYKTLIQEPRIFDSEEHLTIHAKENLIIYFTGAQQQQAHQAIEKKWVLAPELVK